MLDDGSLFDPIVLRLLRYLRRNLRYENDEACPAGIESNYWETSSLPYIGTSVMYYRVEGEEYNSSVT